MEEDHHHQHSTVRHINYNGGGYGAGHGRGDASRCSKYRGMHSSVYNILPQAVLLNLTFSFLYCDLHFAVKVNGLPSASWQDLKVKKTMLNVAVSVFCIFIFRFSICFDF